MESPPPSPPPPQPARLKAKTLKDILAEFESIDQVVFDPIELEQHRDAQPLLPPTFSATSHPFDYFALFFTHDLFKTITTNTNRYAATQRIRAGEEGMREWTDLLVDELYVFIGAIIYMGIHEEPDTSMYWNTDFNKGPLHALPSHMSLRRYQQIKRYCHISCHQSDQSAGYHLPSNKRWWYKLEPLASALQSSFQHYYSPSSEVSIDELMVRCFGR
jgi:hypothetical protein